MSSQLLPVAAAMLQGYSPVFQALLGTLFTWGLTAAGAALVFVFASGQVGVILIATSSRSPALGFLEVIRLGDVAGRKTILREPCGIWSTPGTGVTSTST